MARLVNRALLAATLAFSGVGIAFLLVIVPNLRGRWAAVAALVYGTTLVVSSLFSFLYHTLETARRRRLLRLLDHAAIFLLIAGTYTPFAAVALGQTVGGPLLAWVWTLALLGIALKVVLRESYDRVFVLIYLGIGWVFVVALDDIVHAM